MAFCRRCGDIVSGPRCNKCGGLPVAPVVQWNKQSAQGTSKDRWSQTYVAKSTTPQSALPKPVLAQRPSPSPRLGGATALVSRVSEHIASATISSPSSPIKSRTIKEDAILSAPDVITSPYSSDLSKVYGSVLQPKENVESFHCHVCSAPFTPDATIYPDPKDASRGRYMCRSCFSQNGGGRGNCFECTRPVLMLKSEGGFVENAGRVWHKKCFNCSGCGKSIGDRPVVDLLGHPSCAECFDTCLKRRDSPGKVETSASGPKETVDNSGGFKSASTPSPGKARKGSSTIEELEQVLGIRRRQSALLDQAAPLSDVASGSSPPSPPLPVPNDNPTRPTSAPAKDVAPIPLQGSTPPRPTIGVKKDPARATPEAIEPTKKLLKQTESPLKKREQVTPTRRGRLDGDTSETPTKSPMRYSDFRLLRHEDSTSSIRTDRDSMLSLSSAASTPSLTSDYSDTATISSGPSSPPPSLIGEHEDLASLSSSSPPSSLSGRSVKLVSPNKRSPDLTSEAFRVSTKPPGSGNTHPYSPLPDARCAKCTLPLFGMTHGGRYVSVPEPSSTGSLPRTYHADCFRCRICNGLFEEKEAGRAVFVRGVRGACHLNCAPAESVVSRKTAPVTPRLSTHRLSGTPTQSSREQLPSTASPSPSPSSALSTTPLSSRYSAPLQFSANVSNPMPRFGTSTACPGCSQSVSPMERGVVPGPQGQRWHSSCLVCGGKQAKGRGGRRVNGQPGCGKQLDSSAKRDTGAEGVWCRDCLLLLPHELRSSQVSPTRSSPSRPREPETAAGLGQVDRLHTTLARQFTGADAALARHVTGGRLSPTKQLGLGTPTKVAVQFTGGSRGTIRPRPKSAIGMRGEGRGMFLVQQLTGGGAL